MSNQNITNTLNDMLVICSKNNLEFTLLKEEGENYIKLNVINKTIEVNIFDHDDLKLENMLVEKYKELEELFK
jgi:hypothetical protein